MDMNFHMLQTLNLNPFVSVTIRFELNKINDRDIIRKEIMTFVIP